MIYDVISYTFVCVCALSRFSPQFDSIIPGEALNPIFGDQDVGISGFY